MPRNTNRNTLNNDTVEILNQWQQQWDDYSNDTTTTTMRGKFRHPQRAAFSTQNFQDQIYEIQQVLVDFARVYGVY